MDYRAIAAGTVSSWAALSPSLVPRRWWMTGVSVAAASSLSALGVRLGVRAVRTVRTLARSDRGWPPRSGEPDVRTGLGAGVLGMAAVVTGAALARSAASQREVARLTGMRADGGLEHVAGYLAGGAGWVALEMVVRLSRRTRLRTARIVAAHLPKIPGALVTAAVLAAFLRVEGWFLSRALSRADESAVVDSFARLGPGPRPTERERSGSRESSEPFLTMGFHGRGFVTGGPRSARIAEVWGKLGGPAVEVREPIRVFIGRLGHPSPQEAAAAAVAELERTGAFDREAILMTTGTGSGWVPPWTVSAFEYLMRGDCATVSAQYSFAASWLAFLIHRGPARQLALEVRRAVRARIDSMPPAARPRLYAAGESLGAYGGLGAFASPGAMLRRVDGAVWTGTPRTAAIFAHLLVNRRRGSHEARALYGTGRHFRFAAHPDDLRLAPDGFEYSEWAHPRVVFAQHASDPVVWWSPDLLWRRPDWLREPRGSDVSAAVRWSPIVTFWQLTADMPRSVRLPGGHGHSYHGEVVHYWDAVLGTGHGAEVCEEFSHAIAVDLAPSAGALPITDTGARLRRQPGGG